MKGLPDEIIVQILSLLVPTPQFTTFEPQPECLWSQTPFTPTPHPSNLLNASLTCRRFFKIGVPILYSYLPISFNGRKGHRTLPALLRSFEENPSLKTHIRSAVISTWAKEVHISDVRELFSAPNLETLSLEYIYIGRPPSAWDRKPFGTSNLSRLYLHDTKSEELTSALLSWVPNLKILYLEVRQSDWGTQSYRWITGSRPVSVPGLGMLQLHVFAIQYSLFTISNKL
jgi:hypothetical protein